MDYYQKYTDDVQEVLTEEVDVAVKGMVKETKSEANVDTGNFKRNISHKDTSNTKWSISRTWFVKDPDYRLTHLLINNHKLKNGKTYTSKDFLSPIVEKWQDSFYKKVLERIRGIGK